MMYHYFYGDTSHLASLMTGLLRMRHSILLLVLTVFSQSLSAQQPIGFRPPEVDSAIIAYNAKEFAKAKEWAVKATAINSELREGWEILGFAAQSLNDLPSMINAGTKLSKLLPNERNGWYLLFMGYYKQDRLDLAVEPMKEICRIDPAMCSSSNIDKMLAQVSQDSIGRIDSTFMTKDGAVSIILPKSWHTTTRSDDKTLNWFVTLEKIESDSDFYSVGGVFRWIRNVSNSFVIEEKNNNAAFLVDFWDQFIAAQMKGFTPHMRKVVDSTAFSRDGWSGMIRTVDFQFKQEYAVQRRIEAIVARKDEIFAFTLECELPKYVVYDSRFRKAIASLKLPK